MENTERLDTVAGIAEGLAPLRESILANLVMLAQIPAPTGGEAERVRFLLDRFVEGGIPEAAPDEFGNAVGALPGQTGERTILLSSHLDTIIPDTVDHNVTVKADSLVGPGISDNALGASIVSMLPMCLAQLGIRLDSNLVLLGSTQSLHRGNHAGLRFYLDHSNQKVDYGVVVEGVRLGRLNYFSIGTLRGDIVCDVRPEAPSRTYGSESALVVLNGIVNRILQIPLPSRPYTGITLGRLRAGTAHDIEPDHAELGFQVVSHSDSMLEQLQAKIDEIVSESSSRHGVDAKLDMFFATQCGGIAFSHPLVQCTLKVMGELGIEPDQGHSPTELSEFISRNIPAVTLGITDGEKNTKVPDYVLIEPILKGVAQLIGVVLAIDEGACDGY